MSVPFCLRQIDVSASASAARRLQKWHKFQEFADSQKHYFQKKGKEILPLFINDNLLGYDNATSGLVASIIIDIFLPLKYGYF